jgi:UDP-N-acetylglucosamine 2-epimerase (non-hydrolysing)
MKKQSYSGPVLVVAGTRPEVIKLAPVYLEARKRLGEARVCWVSTGQHGVLERETLARFAIKPDHYLNAGAGGSLLDLNEKVVRGITALCEAIDPSFAVVQGDTVSAFAGAFAAFHEHLPVAHVEAGLRSGDNLDPFPEEAYRRMIDDMASLRFAPTAGAAANLVAEGCREDTIYVTGNTAIDALALVDKLAVQRAPANVPVIPNGQRLIFVTIHRRESWGTKLEGMCHALRDIAARFDDVHMVLPLHVNPRVRETVEPILRDQPRITLTEPLDYVACHSLIREAHLILTDSGGIQEEAPSYHVPVLVLREVTERPEAVRDGLAVLVGTDRQDVYSIASRWLEDPALREGMQGIDNPFGDGQASTRIVTALERFLAGETPLLTKCEQFNA